MRHTIFLARRARGSSRRRRSAKETLEYIDLLGAEVVGELGTQRYDERVDKKFVGTRDVAGLLVGGGIGVRPVFVLPSGLRFSIEVSGTWGRLRDADPGVAYSTMSRVEWLDRARLRAARSARAGRCIRRRSSGSTRCGWIARSRSQLLDATTNAAIAAIASSSLSRIDLRLGQQVGAHVQLGKGVRALRRRHHRLRRSVARARGHRHRRAAALMSAACPSISSRIYTKTGDKGQTALVGGKMVAKDSPRIEAYGTVDELNAILGIVRKANRDEAGPDAPSARIDAILQRAQNELFNLGSLLATLPEDLRPSSRASRPATSRRSSTTSTSSTRTCRPCAASRCRAAAGSARTCTWRARCAAAPSAPSCTSPALEPVDAECVRYVNRLSDALYVIGRWNVRERGETEPLWTPEST